MRGELGYRIKPLAIARRTVEGVECRVHPCLTPESALIGKVDGVMNAVQVKGHAVGSTLYVGPGAGAGPTASSVVADLIDLARGGAGWSAALPAEGAPGSSPIARFLFLWAMSHARTTSTFQPRTSRACSPTSRRR